MVLDLDGVKMGSNSSTFLNICSENDNLNYPERLGRLIVINSPWIFPFLWKIASPFIDAKTKAKISIIYGKYTAELMKFIPPESLPKEYGGDCQCLGSGKDCVEVFDIRELKLSDVSNQVMTTDATDKMTIEARKKHETKLQIGRLGGTVHWFFRVDNKYNINFSVDFFNDNKEKLEVRAPSKLLADQGEFSSSVGGTVTLIFDNSFSYLRAKSIQYSAIVIPNDETPPEQGHPDTTGLHLTGSRTDDQLPDQLPDQLSTQLPTQQVTQLPAS